MCKGCSVNSSGGMSGAGSMMSLRCRPCCPPGSAGITKDGVVLSGQLICLCMLLWLHVRLL